MAKMDAKINVFNSRFIEHLSRADLINLLKVEIEQRLFLEEYVDSLEDKIKKEQDEQRL